MQRLDLVLERRDRRSCDGPTGPKPRRDTACPARRSRGRRTPDRRTTAIRDASVAFARPGRNADRRRDRAAREAARPVRVRPGVSSAVRRSFGPSDANVGPGLDRRRLGEALERVDALSRRDAGSRSGSACSAVSDDQHREIALCGGAVDPGVRRSSARASRPRVQPPHVHLGGLLGGAEHARRHPRRARSPPADRPASPARRRSAAARARRGGPP